MAQATEACGFDAFFRSDHYLAMGGDGLPGPTDAWVTLAALARETSRIRLGTLVSSATFRWPGVLAITVAQVDAMSGGRVELGLGTGWYEGEHTAYGIPFPPLGERFERLEEQLAILTGLWATPVGEKFSFAGTHYQLADSPALPKPVQRPHPPLILGGAGAKRTPRLAATFADEFNVPFHGVADTEAQFGRVRGRLRGRRPRPGESGALGGPGRLLRRRRGRGRSAGPRRSAVRSTSSGPTVRRAHPTRWLARLRALGVGRRGAPSTSRCSTSTISITCA